MAFALTMLALGPFGLTAQQQKAATFTATITADETGQPIAGALVVIDSTYRGVSDPGGHVQITGIEPGSYPVEVSDFSYRTENLRIEFAPGANVQGDFALLPAPIEVTGLVVTAARRKLDLAEVGFYDREKQGMGSFIDEDRIRQVATAGGRVSDALRGARGISLVPVGANAWAVVARRAGGRCRPDIYVDRMPMPEEWSDVNSIASLKDVEGIEVYPSSIDVPTGVVMPSQCGVILIWTYHGG